MAVVTYLYLLYAEGILLQHESSTHESLSLGAWKQAYKLNVALLLVLLL